jgi:hypothetical protein
MRDQRRSKAWLSIEGTCGAAVLGAIIAVGMVRPAMAFTISPVYDSSITSLPNAASIESAFNTVAGDYASSFRQRGDQCRRELGFCGWLFALEQRSRRERRQSLRLLQLQQYQGLPDPSVAQHASNTALATAVAHLPAVAPSGVGQYVVPSSEAKVLGLISPTQTGMDGYIDFAGSVAGYTFNPAGGIAPDTYDFQAVAAHELDEVLGRITGLANTSPSYRTVFDLFRYSATGTLDFGYNDVAYLSIDGGKTSLGTFNSSSAGGGHSDWLTAGTSSDVQDAFISTGQALNLTAADLAGLDALGYGGSKLGGSNAAPTTAAFHLIETPEPASLSLLLTGLVASLAAGTRLRRGPPLSEKRSGSQPAAVAG